MKERPILFSAPMVQAILSGAKSQTRRVAKNHKTIVGSHTAWDMSKCQYGKVGDRLWVKETTIKVEDHGYVGPVYAESDEGRAILAYGLGPEDDFAEVEPHELKLRPSIFMPRSMSRITLEITGVRVERLQDISEADAISEGVVDTRTKIMDAQGKEYVGPIADYAILWEQINGAGSWEANPLVWVVEFKRMEGGIQ